MTLQEKIRKVAKEMDVTISQPMINRIVGTLRFAKVRTAQNLDPLIRKEVKRLVSQRPETSKTAEAEMKGARSLSEIEDNLRRQTCPRCGQRMRDVLLADYTPAIYCDRDCRITLWRSQQDG